MDVHPHTTHLERFARGGCTSSERQQVVRHLLKGCTSCSAQLRDLLHLGVRKAQTQPEPSREVPFLAAGPARPPGGAGAARLLQELAGMAPERQLALVRERLQDAELCP